MWFSHMWNHQQPHLYDNVTQLEMDMTLNREFAKVQSSVWLITVNWMDTLKYISLMMNVFRILDFKLPLCCECCTFI